MNLSVFPLAALLALAPSPDSLGQAAPEHARGSIAQRSASGPTAIATVSVRIITHPARIGHGLAPPRPDMAPRAATIAAADGSQVAALIYDFE